MTTRRDTMVGLAGVGALAALPGVAAAAESAGTTARREVGPIVQHGYVVADVNAAALQWAQKVGVGPFYLFEQAIDNYVYRGKPTKLTMKTAVSYWRDIQIELIQQVSPAATFYSESLRKAPGKLNHFAVLVPDVAAGIAALDAARYVVHTGGTDGGLKFAYLENYLPDGTTLELFSVERQSQMAFEGMKAVSRNWDGTRPIRTMSDLMADLAAGAKAAPRP